MNLYLKNKTITHIFLLILITSCGTSGSLNELIEKEEEIFIKKTNFKSGINQFPSEINIIITNKNQSQEQILEGIFANYFYYKENKGYSPKIIMQYINLNSDKSNCAVDLKSSNFTFLVVSEKDFRIPVKCRNLFQRLNGIQILTGEAQKINGTRLYPFEVKEGNKEIIIDHARLSNNNVIILDQKKDKNKIEIENLWISSGGIVLESEKIDLQNITEVIPRNLFIDESQKRQKKLRNLIRTSLEVTPRSRQDADALILSTSLSNARSLKPSLEYNYGERISVYLIPTWNNVEDYKTKELDLEGTVFIEMPWIAGLNPDFKLNQDIKRNRDFAVGYDSYEIFLLLSSREKVNYQGLSGKITTSQSMILRQDILIEVKEGEILPIGY